VMAERFQRYQTPPIVQQELWHKVFKHVELTVKFVSAFLDRIGEAKPCKDDQMLFAIPPAVEHLVKNMRNHADNLRRAERGLAWLLQCKPSGVLDGFGELKEVLDKTGAAMLAQIKEQTTEDAGLLGQLCAASAA
jgi:hypothetical protein